MNNRLRAAAASLAALAVLGTGFSSFTPSYAAPGDPAAVTITQDTGTLTVTKYLGGADYGAGNGQFDPNVGSITLQGVAFDVRQVYYDAAHTQPVDLKTNDGWAAAAAVVGTPVVASATEVTVNGTTYYMGDMTTIKTGADGKAVFSDIPIGLYLLTENLGASGPVTSSEGATIPINSITPSVPAFVTVPITNATNNAEWDYTVDVQPKNQSSSITKTVTDKGNVTDDLGNTIDNALVYRLNTTSGNGFKLTADGLSILPTERMVISDQLDARDTLINLQVWRPIVRAFAPVDTTIPDGAAELIEGTDYSVYINDVLHDPASGYGNIPAGAKIEVVFTGGQNTNADLPVEVALSVNADTEGNGNIPNTATLMPNQTWWMSQTGSTTPFDPTTDDNTPGPNSITSETVHSLFGDLDITKVDAADASALAGAQFRVYADPTPGDGVCSTSDVAGASIFTDPVTTDATGHAIFKGLQASNFYDGVYQTDLQTYCLVETASPTGYELLAQPIAFEITATGDEVTGYSVAVVPMTVKNAKSNLGNVLPLSGGAGAAGLGLASIVLVGGAVAYGAMRRRQNAKDAA